MKFCDEAELCVPLTTITKWEALVWLETKARDGRGVVLMSGVGGWRWGFWFGGLRKRLTKDVVLCDYKGQLRLVNKSMLEHTEWEEGVKKAIVVLTVNSF